MCVRCFVNQVLHPTRKCQHQLMSGCSRTPMIPYVHASTGSAHEQTEIFHREQLNEGPVGGLSCSRCTQSHDFWVPTALQVPSPIFPASLDSPSRDHPTPRPHQQHTQSPTHRHDSAAPGADSAEPAEPAEPDTSRPGGSVICPPFRIRSSGTTDHDSVVDVMQPLPLLLRVTASVP
jgi:hypothetical protein